MPDGVVTDALTPVPGITDAVDVAIGQRHICVAHATGAVSCWGSDANDQFGDVGFSAETNVPQNVLGLTGVVEIDARGTGTCARNASGEVRCWGDLLSWNRPPSGRIAVGHEVPTHLPGADGATQVVVTLNGAAALVGGTVAGMGRNAEERFGFGRLIPVTLP
jgi:hypothetical protein